MGHALNTLLSIFFLHFNLSVGIFAKTILGSFFIHFESLQITRPQIFSLGEIDYI